MKYFDQREKASEISQCCFLSFKPVEPRNWMLRTLSISQIFKLVVQSLWHRSGHNSGYSLTSWSTSTRSHWPMTLRNMIAKERVQVSDEAATLRERRWNTSGPKNWDGPQLHSVFVGDLKLITPILVLEVCQGWNTMFASPFLSIFAYFAMFDQFDHFEFCWLSKSPLVLGDKHFPALSAGGFSATQRGGSSCGCETVGSLLGFSKGGQWGNGILVKFPLGGYQILGTLELFLWFHNLFVPLDRLW